MSEHRTVQANGTGHIRVLEGLDGAGHVSQRQLAEEVGLALSRVNRIIRSLVTDGYLRVHDQRVRPFAYALTDAGRDHLRRLSHARYDAIITDFLHVRRRIVDRMGSLRRDGVRRVALCGAGDILEVTRPLARAKGLEVVAVVDDDPRQQGTRRGRLTVGAPESLVAVAPEAVVITSFRHADRIRERLENGLAGARVVEL
jgi:DNA-binding MarR family transcriptional regulator